MDAIIFLKEEHSKVKKNLSLISKIKNESQKMKKFQGLCQDLIRHETMEEKVWYPYLRKQSELKKIIKHLVSEEKAAAKMIKKFKQTGFSLLWHLRFYKFKHDVLHHAKEEEKELFPKVRKHFSKKELTDLGIKMKKFKNSLL